MVRKKQDWPIILFVFIGVPFAFSIGGFWIGILVLIIGVTIVGWGKRHSGPFPTKKNKP